MATLVFSRDQPVRYRENKTGGWINARIIIVDDNTITLRLENDNLVVLRKENLTRETIRNRTV